MHLRSIAPPTTVPLRNGIIFLHGYGIRVAAERRHLAVADGVGRQRREARFAKAPVRIKRLVLVAQTGYVTLEALQWLSDVKAAFIHLDHEGTILTASTAGLDDARLRRAQALLPSTHVALNVSRELIVAKIRGQASAADTFELAAGSDLKGSIEEVRGAASAREVLRAEAKAAEAYWDAWSPVCASFARREHVPDHWRKFSGRSSPITSKSRLAADPINALLNYLYALLEVETRISLIQRGLDPGLGILHVDSPNRHSLSADVMEPVRPHVDAFVLNLLRRRTFSSRDFVETREGSCRLAGALTQELAQTMPEWAKLVAPFSESVARSVARLAKNGLGAINFQSTPSLLDRARIKVRTTAIQEAPLPIAGPIALSKVSNSCRVCGAKLTVRKRVYCDQCLPAQRAEAIASTVETFRAAGPMKLAQMRSAGHDPTTKPEVMARRKIKASENRLAVISWVDDGSQSGIVFERDVLPKIANLSVRVIAEAMSSSISHASKVRGGRLKPHKRHWRRLMDVSQEKI